MEDTYLVSPVVHTNFAVGSWINFYWSSWANFRAEHDVGIIDVSVGGGDWIPVVNEVAWSSWGRLGFPIVATTPSQDLRLRFRFTSDAPAVGITWWLANLTIQAWALACTANSDSP